MSENEPGCRITVEKRTVNEDLIGKYLVEKYAHIGQCEKFGDGQEIIIDSYYSAPEGFCPSAWADIRKDVMMVAFGADIPGIRQTGTIITACRDWFRPVYFKVERLDDEGD